ncbi:hypothetical protein VN97_g1557 [Penicillium thymicola]|uniref:Uncharacterized protein n=1 Tax=Penicillium thymicola TaxID=293382 RepID=A0AAI9TS43_PENTH|nr:hypothetical protein VN97_g1557 [Penicillium thymicola]
MWGVLLFIVSISLVWVVENTNLLLLFPYYLYLSSCSQVNMFLPSLVKKDVIKPSLLCGLVKGNPGNAGMSMASAMECVRFLLWQGMPFSQRLHLNPWPM